MPLPAVYKKKRLRSISRGGCLSFLRVASILSSFFPAVFPLPLSSYIDDTDVYPSFPRIPLYQNFVPTAIHARHSISVHTTVTFPSDVVRKSWPYRDSNSLKFRGFFSVGTFYKGNNKIACSLKLRIIDAYETIDGCGSVVCNHSCSV